MEVVIMTFTIKDILENVDNLISDYREKSENYPITEDAFPCRITDLKTYINDLDVWIPGKHFLMYAGDFRISADNGIFKTLSKTEIKIHAIDRTSKNIEIIIPAGGGRRKTTLSFKYTKDDPVLLVMYGVRKRNRQSILLKNFAFVYESELVKAFDVKFPRDREYIYQDTEINTDIFDKRLDNHTRTSRTSNKAEFMLKRREADSPHYLNRYDVGRYPTINFPLFKDIEMQCINIAYFLRLIPLYGINIIKHLLTYTISSICLEMPNKCTDKVYVDITHDDEDDSKYKYNISISIGNTPILVDQKIRMNGKYRGNNLWLGLSTKKALPVHICISRLDKDIFHDIPYCDNKVLLEEEPDTNYPSIDITEERLYAWTSLIESMADNNLYNI